MPAERGGWRLDMEGDSHLLVTKRCVPSLAFQADEGKPSNEEDVVSPGPAQTPVFFEPGS
jgi:hypothetical protein